MTHAHFLSHSGLSTGAIVAIAVVIPVVVLGALLAVWLCYCRRQHDDRGAKEINRPHLSPLLESEMTPEATEATAVTAPFTLHMSESSQAPSLTHQNSTSSHSRSKPVSRMA